MGVSTREVFEQAQQGGVGRSGMRRAVANAGARQVMIDLLRTALDGTWGTP